MPNTEIPLLVYTRRPGDTLELVIAPGNHTCKVYEIAPELAFKLGLELLDYARTKAFPHTLGRVSCETGCPTCLDTGWVCESHPDKPWTPEGCQCNAGMPCRTCRKPAS